jgi:glutamate racemase
MKKQLFLIFFLCSQIFASETVNMTLATVDSGFGGYFTAKALEKEANSLSQSYDVQFAINHYGDTLNAPYGEKTPDQIADYASKIIIKAHEAGAKHVFLACNTASTQFEKIQKILRENEKTKAYADNTYSIIDSSILTLQNRILELSKKSDQDIHLVLLVTPATLKSDIYPKRLQEAFHVPHIKKSEVKTYEQDRWRKVKSKVINSAFSEVSFSLPKTKKQKVFVYQMAPGNWVEMIEYQASQGEKDSIIARDIKLLTESINKSVVFDIVAHFCTHFPVFDKEIKNELVLQKKVKPNAEFIQQGEIFAKEFVSLAKSQENLKPQKNSNSALLVPRIFITGTNKAETETLVRTIFPEQKNISVEILK